MRLKRWVVVGVLGLNCAAPGRAGAESARTASQRELSANGVAVTPPRRAVPSPADLDALRQAVSAEPRKRRPRLELVRALLAAGKLEDARLEAERWREHDAYNLVAVRLLG